jgi:hypothetical protein
MFTASRKAITVHDGKMVAEASDLGLPGFPAEFQVPDRNGNPVTFIAAMDIRDRENEIVKVLYIAPGVGDLVVFND